MAFDKPKFRVVLIVALALLTSGLVYSYLKGLQTTAQDEGSVVVVSQKVAAGTKLTQEMVKVTRMPSKYISQGAFSASNNVVNQYAAVDLYPDQVVLKEQLASAETSSEMNFKVPEGKRAVTIAIDQVSGLAGYLKPGNYVDIIFTLKPEPEKQMTQSLTPLQNIQVLAVGSQILTKEESQTAATNVSLAVTPQQAQYIALIENTGKMKLTLRPINDANNVPTGVSDHKALMSQ